MDLFFGLFLKAKFPLFFGTVSNKKLLSIKDELPHLFLQRYGRGEH
jgi:hypothetical protein